MDSFCVSFFPWVLSLGKSFFPWLPDTDGEVAGTSTYSVCLVSVSRADYLKNGKLTFIKTQLFHSPTGEDMLSELTMSLVWQKTHALTRLVGGHRRSLCATREVQLDHLFPDPVAQQLGGLSLVGLRQVVPYHCICGSLSQVPLLSIGVSYFPSGLQHHGYPISGFGVDCT